MMYVAQSRLARRGAASGFNVHVPTRMVLEVRGPDGSLVWKASKPKGEKAVSNQTAFLMNDILAGNSDPKINAAWGPVLKTRGPGGNRRPVNWATQQPTKADGSISFQLLRRDDPKWRKGV